MLRQTSRSLLLLRQIKLSPATAFYPSTSTTPSEQIIDHLETVSDVGAERVLSEYNPTTLKFISAVIPMVRLPTTHASLTTPSYQIIALQSASTAIHHDERLDR